MRWTFSVAILVFATQLALGSGSSNVNSSLFPDLEGWRGGDAAYSIPIDAHTTVWLFGDTFVGARQAGTMIHNSIALRSCHPECSVSYWWRGKGTDKATAFFATPATDYFWPLDGFLQNGRLYVFLEQMHVVGKGGPIGFDYSGVTLATIANPYDEPSGWHISYHQVAHGNQVIPGIAVASGLQEPAAESYLYVFTLMRQNVQAPFLGILRTRLETFDKEGASSPWRYLSQDNKWVQWNPSSTPANPQSMLNGNVTEMSVKFHWERKEWVAIFPTPAMLSKTASYSTAKSRKGPWTTPRHLFTYPETTSADSRYTPQVFCYAAKEHPELEESGTLAFTYACNSMKESDIFKDPQLYRPQLVRMPLPKH